MKHLDELWEQTSALIADPAARRHLRDLFELEDLGIQVARGEITAEDSMFAAAALGFRPDPIP